MAELIVSPLLKLVMGKLDSGLWKELTLLRGVKKDILKLQSTLSTIKDVLEDAEQSSISDKPLCSWLKKLKDAAYDADDVMDEIQTEALRRRIENDGHPLKGQRLKIYQRSRRRRRRRRRRRGRQVAREKEDFTGMTTAWQRPGRQVQSFMGLSDRMCFAHIQIPQSMFFLVLL